MTDTLTKDQRRRIMQANRGRTQVERLFASALWRRGLRYVTDDGYKSRYGQRLPGSPDVVFPPKRVTAAAIRAKIFILALPCRVIGCVSPSTQHR